MGRRSTNFDLFVNACILSFQKFANIYFIKSESPVSGSQKVFAIFINSLSVFLTFRLPDILFIEQQAYHRRYHHIQQ